MSEVSEVKNQDPIMVKFGEMGAVEDCKEQRISMQLARGRIYDILSNALSYPWNRKFFRPKSLLEPFDVVLLDEEDWGRVKEMIERFGKYLPKMALKQVQAECVRVFGHAVSQECPPYEMQYGTEGGIQSQTDVLQRRTTRPRLRQTDRLFWLLVRRLWTGWKDALVLVRPATVVRWHQLAFRTLLDSDLSTTTSRPATGESRDSGAHPSHGGSQSVVGRSTRPQRAAQDRHRSLTANGWAPDAAVSQPAVANLAELPRQPRSGLGLNRLLHDPHGDLPCAVRLRGPPTPPSACGALQRHGAPDSRMDRAAGG